MRRPSRYSSPKRRSRSRSHCGDAWNISTQTKGYGFIKDLDSTEKYFFHISNAPADIAEGALVTFETERGQRGLNAVNIAYAK